MKEKFWNAFKVLWVLIAVGFGTYGHYLVFDGDLLRSFYSALLLFALNPSIDVIDFNIYILISAFMASIAVATIVITLIQAANSYLRVMFYRMKNKAKDRVYIHTDCPEEVEPLLDDMKRHKKRYIVSDVPNSFKDGEQLFFFSKKDTLISYMLEHSKHIHEDDGIYVYCEERDRDAFPGKGIYNVSLSENAARLYWQEHIITDPNADVVIIGFGNYGEALLSRALYMNVIAVDSQITYHVFPLNDGEKTRLHDFLAMHAGMKNFMDVVPVGDADYTATMGMRRPGMDGIVVYDGEMFGCIDLLKKSRIILASDEDDVNLSILSNLQKSMPLSFAEHEPIAIRLETQKLYDTLVKTGHVDGKRKPSNKEQNYPEVYLWGDKDRCLTYDIVFGGKLVRNAKIRDAYWKKMYSDSIITGYPELVQKYHLTKEMIEAMNIFEVADSEWYQEIWNDFSTHMRETNIALADHTVYKLWLLAPEKSTKDELRPEDIKGLWAKLREVDEEGKAKDAVYDLVNKKMNRLAEIEHVRWMRFHYMNNFTYSTEKNFDKRTHNTLLSYDDMIATFGNGITREEMFTMEPTEIPKELRNYIESDMQSYWDLGTYLE